ncbi:nuclease-related domain-containing protein [Anaerotruncus sp.]|jgi:hypothetical protein|uniref:nuclease-related domain-containing protein n=1 Tax=Anaerotruncus sp. TaxID=1872531 RepID=UPI002171A4E3|nr:nuclease-related domain-containing protein [Anaerotruncus sp.]MCI8491548.1 NERD domain-containing protein [Anaerotruncus sp.]
MQTGQMIFLALCAAVFIIGVALFIYKKAHPDTVENEKRKVSKRLRTFAAPRGFRVLDNVRLVSGGLSGWADHVLVGYFGVLLVYDLCYGGEYYGANDDKQWIINDGGKRYAADNPRIHAQQCSGRVITLLREAGYRVNVDSVAVITVGGKKTESFLKADNVIKLSKLGAYLGRGKFDEDKGLDVAKVAAVLEAASR